MNALKAFTKDARNFQIAYLSIFLLYGIWFLNWAVDAPKIISLIGSCIVCQFIWIKYTGKNITALKSGLITALGLCLLLKSNSIWALSLAGLLAISSKFVIRIRNKHLFNPANFGIIASILITGDTWVSPGQWGSSFILIYFLGACALIVLLKVGRIDTSIVFLLSLFTLEYIRTCLYQGWEFDYLLHKFSSGTLLLYAFFMITDPMTIPNHKKGRVIWAILLAFFSFAMSNWWQLYTAPIWVLFFITPVTVLLDKVWKAKKFEWIPSVNNQNKTIINL